MAVLLYHSFSFLSLFSFSLYHLISSSRHPPTPPTPYHPLPLQSPLRHLPLYLAFFAISLSILHFSLSFTTYLFPSLQHAAALLLFLFLAISLLLPSPLPVSIFHLLSSLAFFLLYLSSTNFSALYPVSDLQSHAASTSALISAASAGFCLTLAICPHLFVASFGLSVSVMLQGLWSLQTGLSLYVDGFIPEGCHRLLDVVEASTRCDLRDSQVRAAGVLDLAFVLHTVFVAVVGAVVYMAVARVMGGGGRRQNGGAYEALPMTTGAEQIQMKAIGKSSTQA